jgi:uncharacterized caspase-like protein
MLRSALSILAFVALATGLAAQAPSNRAALVIGNSAYKSSPLANPVNDATDIAASLKDAGFEVILRTDADLASMEKALADFQTLCKGKDTALFYYAGHGVQVGGENYLIPVKEDIQSESQAKSRGVALGDLMDRVKTSGVKTALVFLDACRDNPFPGSSRSGTRGLAVVAAPPEVETCIAYATQPGNVAQDGSGRNGVFTAAMLKNLGTPGASLSDLMTSVMADVKQSTGGKQQPRVDNGLTKPFYFVDPAVAAARAQAALDKSKSELAGLDSKLADLQKQIAASGDTQAKQKLQVEQQRQQALQQAKALESQNLAAAAAKQQAAADAAAKLAAERATAQAASLKAQSDLSNLAAARRAELDKLATAAASDNPDVLIDTVERLEKVLAEVDGQYAAALASSLAASNSGWDKQLASISGQQPDIIETDAEFALRIAGEKSALEQKRQGELSSTKANIEGQRTSQTASMRKQFNDTLTTLQARVWTVTGSNATLTIGAFDRNARTWPFVVASADPTIPMVPVTVVANLGSAADPRAAIVALDTAVKANALAAEFDWGITRDSANKRYALDIRAVRVRNLTSNEVVAQSNPQARIAYFVTGKRNAPLAAVGTLSVTTSSKDGPGDVYVDGNKLGTTPFTLKMAEGTAKIEVKWGDRYSRDWSGSATLAAGAMTKIAATKSGFKFGETGPAGGIIFYDKGSVSDGWRYLEAAPKDQSTGIQWYNGSNKDVSTSTAIGSGKANTDAIIAAQGSGNYAATLCRNLTIGGFSDWFLPSKDELNLMYTNLKKANLGGFGGSWLWSSSQNVDYNAWGQRFFQWHSGLRRQGQQYFCPCLSGLLTLHPFIHFLGVRGRAPDLSGDRKDEQWPCTMTCPFSRMSIS